MRVRVRVRVRGQEARLVRDRVKTVVHAMTQCLTAVHGHGRRDILVIHSPLALSLALIPAARQRVE